MDRIAYIIDETFLYWNSIILTLAVAGTICLFLFLYLREKGNGLSAALLIPLSVVLSLYLSRWIHWYCRADAYESMATAMTSFTGGGYALMGVFGGCALAAVLLRLVRIVKNLPMVFDCLAISGAAGISLGRLACLYTSADRGMLVENTKALPWVYPVNNSVTGVVEWRMATFMIQSMVAAVLFVVLLAFYLNGQKGRRRKLKDGDTAWLFLAVYGASQVMLDSTRYDSLFMRSNGFISIVQILGAVAIVFSMVHFSIRMVKARGYKGWYIALWVLFVALVGGAGFMEYWVQRHGNIPLFCYSIMSACLVGIVTLICVVRLLAVTEERKKTRKTVVESAKK